MADASQPSLKIPGKQCFCSSACQWPFNRGMRSPSKTQCPLNESPLQPLTLFFNIYAHRLCASEQNKIIITRWRALDRVQTLAGDSITFSWNMFLHFVTLWPRPLTIWPNIKLVVRMDYPCGRFGDCSFSHFGSIMWTNTQTHLHTHTNTRMNPILHYCRGHAYVFMVLSLWQIIARVYLVHLMNVANYCWSSDQAGGGLGLRKCESSVAILLLLGPKVATHFTVPQRVEV